MGQTLVVGISSLQFAVFGKSRYGLASTLHLLLSRKFALSVRACIAIEYIVYARHITVERTCSKQRQSIRHSYAQRCLTSLGIIGLREWIDGCHHSQPYSIASIVQSLHGSKFHWLHLCHLHSRRVTRMYCQQRGNNAHDTCNLDALSGKLLLATSQQIPAADGTHKHGTNYPR